MAAANSSEAMRNTIRYQQARVNGAPAPLTEQEQAQALRQTWKDEVTKFLVTVQRVVSVLKNREQEGQTFITEAVRQATEIDVTAAGHKEVKRIQDVVFPILLKYQKEMEAKSASMKLTLIEQLRLTEQLLDQIEELLIEVHKPSQERRDTKTIEKIGTRASETIAGTSIPRKWNTRI